MCSHTPQCPTPESPGHLSARVVAQHPEQSWSLLCNGVVVFDDGGEIFPDGHVTGANRVPPPRRADKALA